MRGGRVVGVKGDAEQTVRLEKTGSPAWVHPNAGERGYYRWLAPPEALQALAGSGPGVLDPRERVGFLNNLSALLDAGLLSGDEYLRTLVQFTDDPAPDVVSSVIAGLDKVHDAFISPDLRGSFAIMVRRTLRPSLRRFGITRSPGEPEAVSLMRPGLLAALGVYAYEREVLDWARPAARRYLAHPDSVDASVVGAALNLAARDGDTPLFEAYRLRLETTKIPSERARFLTALGHFRNGELLERALDYALTGPLRPQEILAIPSNVAENDELKDRVWRWFRAGYRNIAQRIPPFYLPNLPSFARTCGTQRIEEARVFFSYPETNFPGTREELDKVIEQNKDCAGMRERETPAVARYLTRTAQTRTAPTRTPGP